jgi:hypothetical protein
MLLVSSDKVAYNTIGSDLVDSGSVGSEEWVNDDQVTTK